MRNFGTFLTVYTDFVSILPERYLIPQRFRALQGNGEDFLAG